MITTITRGFVWSSSTVAERPDFIEDDFVKFCQLWSRPTDWGDVERERLVISHYYRSG